MDKESIQLLVKVLKSYQATLQAIIVALDEEYPPKEVLTEDQYWDAIGETMSALIESGVKFNLD
jgi:hypothetical protein